jgi:crotonobetainyl-CoA:carnitine CoA-transferase CaiB-like acyl-CoA transferase
VAKPPLHGIRVIEAASYLSGPYAGMMLADLGADVVKIEPPKGDPFRRFGRPRTAMSAVFANSNRGKRSVVLDLKDPGDQQRMLALLESADILLSNWRPEVAARFGLADEVLADAFPQLIRLWVSGFGPTGPSSKEPAFDSVVQARSGVTEAGAPTDDPVLLAGYPIDKLSAAMVTQAALAAIIARQRDGRGDRVDVAMLDATAYVNFVEFYGHRTFLDHAPEDPKSRHLTSVRPIKAGDGWLVTAPVSAGQVSRACTAVGHPEWVDDVLAIPDQVAMVRDLLSRLETATVTGPVEKWLELFRQHDVPAAECVGMDQHLTDPQVLHNQLYSVSDWPGLGPVRSVRYPARFASVGLLGTEGRSPSLGEHTDEILKDLPTPEL